MAISSKGKEKDESDWVVLHEDEVLDLLSQDSEETAVSNFQEQLKLDVPWNGLDHGTKAYQLYEAVCTNNLKAIQKLQANYLWIVDAEGCNVLHLASGFGHTSLIKYFHTEIGIGVNCTDAHGFTPLHYVAIFGGSSGTVKLLLEYGAKISIKDKFGRQVLSSAIYSDNNKDEKRNLEVISLLLKHKAEINDRCHNGWAALHYAIIRQSKPLVQLLLQYNPDLEAETLYGCTVLHFAVRINNAEIVKLLLTKGVDVDHADKEGKCAIHIAVAVGNIAIIDLLHEANLNVVCKDRSTILTIAIHKGNVTILESLLKKDNMDVNLKDEIGYTALHYATRTQNIDAMKLLIKHKANVMAKSNDGVTALSIATEYQNFDIMQLLLNNGADANELKNGMHNLIFTIKYNAEETRNICELLLDNRANVNATDARGKSALYISTENGNIEIVKLVIKYGPKIDLATLEGLTALHCATYRKDIEIVKLLLTNKANPDVQTNEGSTCLHISVANDQVAIIQELLHHGANSRIEDKKKYNPIEYAAYLNSTYLMTLFKDSNISFTEKDDQGVYKISQFPPELLEDILDRLIKRENENLYIELDGICSRNESLLIIFHKMSQEKNLNRLFQHPVIRAYVHWKWTHITKIYKFNVFVFCLTWLLLFSLLYIEPENVFAKILFSIFPILLLSREILQLRTDKKYYKKNSMENLSEIALAFLIIIFIWNSDPDSRKQISAVYFILSAISCTLLLGKHPRYSMTIHLLSTVTSKFWKYFKMYLIIILSFVVSFHTLFISKNEGDEKNVNNTTENEVANNNDTDFNPYDYYALSLLQTAVMFIGNVEVKAITLKEYSVLTIAVLLFFMIFITIIMINLLNGLAVSDILGKDELIRSNYIAHVEYLYNTIKMINKLKDIVSLITPNFEWIKIRDLHDVSRIYVYPNVDKEAASKKLPHLQFICNNDIRQDIFIKEHHIKNKDFIESQYRKEQQNKFDRIEERLLENEKILKQIQECILVKK